MQCWRLAVVSILLQGGGEHVMLDRDTIIVLVTVQYLFVLYRESKYLVARAVGTWLRLVQLDAGGDNTPPLIVAREVEDKVALVIVPAGIAVEDLPGSKGFVDRRFHEVLAPTRIPDISTEQVKNLEVFSRRGRRTTRRGGRRNDTAFLGRWLLAFSLS